MNKTANIRISILSHIFFTLVLVIPLPLLAQTAQDMWQVIPAPPAASEENNQYRLALYAEGHGDYQTALNYFHQLRLNYPAKDHYLQGEVRCLTALLQFEQAESVLQTEINRSSAVSDYRRKAGLLIDLGNIYLSWEGHQGQANSCWEQALNINETDPDIYHRISLNFLNRRMVDKAIEYLKRGDRLIGKGVLTLDLANAHTLRMDYGNATNYYLQYLIQDPNRFNYVERAICAFPTDDQVTTPVISALKANASAVSQRLLTGYLFSLAKYDEVFKYLDQTKLTPDESLTYASQLLTEARPDLALKLYQSLQKGSIPDKFLPSALLGEADCHFRSGEFRLAIDLYQKIPVQFPRTPSAETALFRSGEIYWENLNLLDSSRYCFEKLCAEYPYGSYYFQAQLKLGLCSLISGDLDQALNFYRRVSTISDKRSLELKSEAMLATGRCWLWKGEPDSALAVFDQLARLYPNTDAANDALNDAMLLNKSGDKSLLYLFSSAWLASIRKDYTLSLKGYKRIMEAAPGTALASRSALSSTEDLLTSVNDFANALSLLQDYLDRNPDCENKDALNFKMAEIFQFYAHDAQKSSHHYEQVLLETPDSPLVPIARKRLQELGTGI